MRMFVAACLLGMVLVDSAGATDRYFADIHSQSPSGQFRVDAVSPDNEGDRVPAFQARFTYTCLDSHSGATLWTRKQAMRAPVKLSRDSEVEIAFPEEGSPVAIHVSDSGATAICTDSYQLIIVSAEGAEAGKIELLQEALTDAEQERFVHHTTAGPWWTGLSAWYFLETPAAESFVIRPWWGRRIFIDVRSGTLTRGDPSLVESATNAEKKLVLSALYPDEPQGQPVLSEYAAAYLAGVLQVRKALRALRTLEESTYSGRSTTGGLSFGEDFDNEVDPHSYSTFSLRQVAQLSLRRLGARPAPLPCHSFDLVRGDSRTEFNPPRPRPRHETIEEVSVGMSAKQVLSLVGAPDFVGYDSWSYDMDADPPSSITLTFDARRVTRIQKDDALWRSGKTRDEALAY